MIPKFSAGTVTYRWSCAACETEHEETRNYRSGDLVYEPTLPAGWTALSSGFYCPAHTVMLLVDGKERPL